MMKNICRGAVAENDEEWKKKIKIKINRRKERLTGYLYALDLSSFSL